MADHDDDVQAAQRWAEPAVVDGVQRWAEPAVVDGAQRWAEPAVVDGAQQRADDPAIDEAVSRTVRAIRSDSPLHNIEDTVQLDEAGQYDPAAERMLSPDEIKLLRLRTNGPRGRFEIVYLARNDDDLLVCVATQGDLQVSRVFIGTGSPLPEVALTGDWLSRIVRYRDGGTTDISTERGVLHVPSPQWGDPYKPGGVSFDGRPMTLMDVGGVVAELTADGLVLL